MQNKEGEEIEIYGDSQLVVKQMNGEWGVKKGAYAEYAYKASILLCNLKEKNTVTIQWIPREQNEKADYQSMKAIGFERKKWK
jgi:ribonuclease HI